ncbi:ATP-dependent nuclease [Leptospira dzoumogneensis]|uniref:ATPase AAA-type core domain-containing protein n=1 Tax=Leptospira dzoumogneensis TaxID=2484904 RepID=A0A4Z1ADF3_9LEPT|nr:AAA family ATPase [Leptospira dzoumogneensis]TGN00019.1 hypothetical protein EHR06_07820 [Leptospira dzoumogneensis]
MLIKKIGIENFGCYRKETKFAFNDGSFLIGANNSGKSFVLKAIEVFFDSDKFNSDLINKSEYTNKGKNYNKSRIEIEFNLGKIKSDALKKRLRDLLGKNEKIVKTFTFREVSKTILIEYTIQSKKYTDENLHEDIKKLLGSISISYIHPQEGREILLNAQAKLKERLLANWGRHSSISESIDQLKNSWLELRERANSYLSSSLTANLKNIWPTCEIKINLPQNIEEVLAISDIEFRGDPTLPEINITSQGTGAQTTILFQTHFLLDSDRSLHRGEYHPVWLLEEPESFLHADITIKLGKLLNSSEWLKNIQIITTTHSPLLIATSNINSSNIRWSLLEKAEIVKTETSDRWSESDIKEMGKMLGDSNFLTYFETINKDSALFIEDTRKETIEMYSSVGIEIKKALNGIGEVKKYIEVIESYSDHLNSPIFFLVDCDEGKSQIEIFLKNQKSERKGVKLYEYRKNLFIILLPPTFAIENLFEEYDSIVKRGIAHIVDSNLKPVQVVASNFSRAHGHMRGKKYTNEQEVILDLRKQQDFKDYFWAEVKKNALTISNDYVEIIKEYLSYR